MMICPKGSECLESSHEVKTLQCASEWFDSIKEEDIPITISKFTTTDGRIMLKVISKNGEVIHSRG